jgi:unsaturated rhamnogalacturonyl hydrolase
MRWLALLALVVSGCSDPSGEMAGRGQSDASEVVASSEVDARTSSPMAPFDWCEPDVIPDGDCFARMRDPESTRIALATSIATKQMASHPPTELAWNWEEAVMLLSFLELYKVTGDESLVDYCAAYLDHHVAVGYKMGTSDTCAPASVAVWLYHMTGRPSYKVVADDALNYLYTVANRTESGGISHLGIVDIVTLWVDSLFMFGNVFISWHETTGDPVALDAMGEQFAIFSSVLQDPGGFYVHASDWIVEQTPGVYWARGNGWVAAAGASYLRLRTLRGEKDEVVLVAWQELMAAAVSAQDESGLWWTIVNHPGEAYLETSGAALFAYGMARGWRYGLLDDDVLGPVAAAMSGVLARVIEDADGQPVVTGISGPTSADKLDVYLTVPLADDLPFGIGAVILALVETSGLPTL